MPHHPVSDDIIVGAGSAGGVLAHRLTEDASTPVLLLEAGAPDRPLTLHMPAAGSTVFQRRDAGAYDTVPQPHRRHRRLYWPRGTVFGGSRAIKALLDTRGQPSDDDPGHALGHRGWRVADGLPSFTQGKPHEGRASASHGIGGPLHVADRRSTNPRSQAFLAAGVALGLPRPEACNGPDPEGVGWCQVTPRGGTASARPRRTSRRRGTGAISRSGRPPTWAACASTGTARWASGSGSTVAPDAAGRPGRSGCVRAPSMPPRGSGAPASAAPHRGGAWAGPWSWTSPGSASSCRTIAAAPWRAPVARRGAGPAPGRWGISCAIGGATKAR